MAINSRAPLDRSPKKNWVENAGGLPMYIRRIANHLHQEKGMTISRAIAVAVNVVKRMCATGDLNFPGKQSANAKSRAQACKAVAEWERKKASARVSKGIKGRKLTDHEYIEMVIGKEQGFTDAEFDEYESLVDKVFDGVDEEIEFHAESEIVKRDDDKQLVFGWASVAKTADGETVVDKQGDVLDDIEAMEDVAYNFVLHSRDGGEMHVRKGVSTLVESFVSTPEKWKAMNIPEGTLPVGWWVGFRVNDPEVWKAVKNDKYRMFSVHGTGTRKAFDDE